MGTNQMDHERGRTRARTKFFKVTCRSSLIGALKKVKVLFYITATIRYTKFIA